MSKHTIVPWEVAANADAQGNLMIVANECFSPHIVAIVLHCDDEGDFEADAAFIVQACNSHDDLLAAVEATHAYFLACTAQAVAEGKHADEGTVHVEGVALDELGERAGELTGRAMDKIHGNLTTTIEGTDEVSAQTKLRETNKALLTELEGVCIVLQKLHDKHCKEDPVPAVLASLALADLAIKKAKGG